VAQLLLFPDPRPLEVQLGRSFFLRAPTEPGVYVMKDAAEVVLYVGKAKNLRQRLNYYRVANPNRLRRRQLRLLAQVKRIELQVCCDEAAALEHEARLLRSLKPKFNRAGVWPGAPHLIACRAKLGHLQMIVQASPESEWERLALLSGGVARNLHRSLSRLLWLAVNPARTFADLPNGWAHGRGMQSTSIVCGDRLSTVLPLLKSFFVGQDNLLLWFKEAVLDSVQAAGGHGMPQADFETLEKFHARNQHHVLTSGRSSPAVRG
jgi:GIY-YIG catalytic domain